MQPSARESRACVGFTVRLGEPLLLGTSPLRLYLQMNEEHKPIEFNPDDFIKGGRFEEQAMPDYRLAEIKYAGAIARGEKVTEDGKASARVMTKRRDGKLQYVWGSPFVFDTTEEANAYAAALIRWVKDEWMSPARKGLKFIRATITREQVTDVLIQVPKDYDTRLIHPANFNKLLVRAAKETCDSNDWEVDGWEQTVEWSELKEVPESEGLVYDSVVATEEELTKRK